MIVSFRAKIRSHKFTHAKNIRRFISRQFACVSNHIILGQFEVPDALYSILKLHIYSISKNSFWICKNSSEILARTKEIIFKNLKSYWTL